MNQPEIDLNQLQKTVRVNRQVINRLKERVSLLEDALELVCGDEQMQWLYRNRRERMDATVPMFAPSRAAFHLARYEFACRYVEHKTVADIACGTGYGSRMLIETGKAHSVTGVDVCAETIDYATDRHHLTGCEFVCADATSTGLSPDSLDVVVSFETIEHVQDDEALINEFARLLKADGLLICSTPNQWPLDIAPHHVREYDRDSFNNLLNHQFQVLHLYNQNSGSDFQYNHDQPAGITPTTYENHELAECFLAVARLR
ncbi:MAG: class I SAM-dependent methyltransferase [Pirellulaceae bacterium]